MNIFFNSRINANQSLLNVLFGQQQKAASRQNTGCRGIRDTLTIREHINCLFCFFSRRIADAQCTRKFTADCKVKGLFAIEVIEFAATASLPMWPMITEYRT